MDRKLPSMTALLGLLAIAGYQNRDKIAEVLRGDGTPGSGGGLLGKLGGMFEGATSGSVVSGGVGELVDKFKETGHGEVADSWVGTGPNKPLAPGQLEKALGTDVLDTLAARTGLSKQELLAKLETILPSAVDKYTPDGRLPAHE
jgi:uncharacterized protein YidB (DUF937 family)